jgi:hypothetical protein
MFCRSLRRLFDLRAESWYKVSSVARRQPPARRISSIRSRFATRSAAAELQTALLQLPRVRFAQLAR